MKRILSPLLLLVIFYLQIDPPQAHAAPLFDLGLGDAPFVMSYIGSTVDDSDMDCEMVDEYTIHCVGHINQRDTSNGYADGVNYYHIPVTGIPDGTHVYWSFTQNNFHSDGYPWDYDFVTRPGFTDSVDCNPVAGGSATPQGSTGDCIIHTIDDAGDILLPCDFQGGLENDISCTWDFIWSIAPITNCDYITLTEDTFVIDPTIETPLGPAGSPPDDQIYPTLEGSVYKFKMGGGPWYDGSAYRGQQYEVSWDGIVWAPLTPICEEIDGTIYFVAEGDTFHIRVPDIPGAFADNTSDPDLTYTIGLTSDTVATCESQYTYDDFEDVVGFTGVNSTSQNGVLGNNSEDLIIGDWYTVRWAYDTWMDDGSPPERTDLQYLMAGNWEPLAAGSGAVWCVSADGLEVLFQATATTIMLRVNDEDSLSDFLANTGTPYYTLYHASFTRTPEACETNIQIGDLIEHRTVQADQANGAAFATLIGGSSGYLDAGLVPGAWYVLDTVDGPWWNAVLSATPTYQYDMAVEEGKVGTINSTWTPLADWTVPVCNVELDALGHRRIIFQMPSSGDLEWRLRVNDIGSFLTNQGSMSWDLYGATQYQIDPETGSCDYSYDEFDPLDIGTVAGNNADGAPLDGLVSGNIYAIKIVGEGYGWQESALGDTLYDMQISHNNGVEYYDIPEGYPGVLCAEETGNDLLIYVKPGANYNYKLRVDSSTFTNNTGEMGYVVYSASAGQTIENTCLDGWSKQSIDEFTWIDVRAEMGQLLTTDNARYEEFIGLVPGRTYYVETPADQGPWKTKSIGGESKWTTALSSDNGSTWHELGFDNPDIDCAVRELVGNVWGARFTVAEGDLWKIRVNDTAGEFADNGGNMAFKFFVLCEGMSCTGSIPDDSDNIPAISIQGGGNVCSMAVLRPGPLTVEEIFNLGNYIGAWLQYANLSTLRFMAWCPKHTSMFLQFINAFKDREPLATVYEWEDNLVRIQQQIESYDWGDNAQQEQSIFDQTDDGELQQWIYQHFFAKGDSSWNGGNLVEFGDGILPSSYYSCGNSFTAILPPRLISPICFVSAWFIESSASFWVQLIIDISAIALLFTTIKEAVQDAVYMMTGVKPWVKSSNRSNWVTIENGVNDMRSQPTATGDQVIESLAQMLGGQFERNPDGTYRRVK